MCGISGYIDLKHGVKPDILAEMTDIIDYRGPDDEGYALFSKDGVVFAKGRDSAPGVDFTYLPDVEYGDFFAGFGHRRLSILDLSILGHQPMEKHAKVLTYNGEIYNYIELREELQGYGYEFESSCDSEVILSAYDYWGEKCVNRFNGMWALAIYDMDKHMLFLSRDRFGVKPLYYYINENRMLFSSEIKQILCDEAVPRIVNEECLAHYLKYNFREYSDATFFEGIYTLRGGCNMIVEFDFANNKFGKVKVDRYYDLQQKIVVEKSTNSADVVGDALRQAIKIRMRSDVKLGSCLSGGLDSSSIVGIIHDEFKKSERDTERLTTVSIGFPEETEINELDYAHQVANYCNCEEHVIVPDINSVMEHLEKIVWHQDEPLPHLGSEVSYAVFKGAADKGCSVFYDGQGGDEGLSGYYFYYANYLWNALKKEGIAAFLKKMKAIVSSSSMTYKSVIMYVLYFNFPFVRDFGTGIRRNKYLSKNTKKSINKKHIGMFFEARDGLGRQIEDYLYGSLPCILHWEDRNSMASSVETRLPFLDYEYVEKVLAVDISEKLEGGYTKTPLRRYMKDMLPETVIWRKNKLGFASPKEKWLWEMPQGYVMDLFETPRSKKYFRIDRLKRDYLRQSGNVEMISKFILVELWMRKFEVQEGVK